MTKKIAIVTGGNRGLGFELCRELGQKGYQVILTCRDSKKGKQKTEELVQEGLSVVFHPLDVHDLKSIQETIQWTEKTFGRLDLLINNAGILLDRHQPATKEILMTTFETNVTGPYLLCELAGKLMAKNQFGRIVNVSSESGQLSSMGSGDDAYAISKAALNAVTRIFSSKLRSDGILVNSVCPGWVDTDMGSLYGKAPLSVEEGVDTILFAAELPQNGPTGRFFQRRREIPW